MVGIWAFGHAPSQYYRHQPNNYSQLAYVRCSKFVGKMVKIPFFNHFSISTYVKESGSRSGIEYIKLISKEFSSVFHAEQIIEIPEMKDIDGITYKFKVKSIVGDSVCLYIQ